MLICKGEPYRFCVNRDLLVQTDTHTHQDPFTLFQGLYARLLFSIEEKAHFPTEIDVIWRVTDRLTD